MPTQLRDTTLALEAMMRDGQITRDRALEIARAVLRENAIQLYGLATETTKPATSLDLAPPK